MKTKRSFQSIYIYNLLKKGWTKTHLLATFWEKVGPKPDTNRI
jgi:hypothetical protein